MISINLAEKELIFTTAQGISAYSLKSKLTNKKVCFELKLRIMCAPLESIILYNRECCEINKELENKIDIFERKIRRNILEISNKDLYKLKN